MKIVQIELNETHHRLLKSTAALRGMTIRELVLERLHVLFSDQDNKGKEGDCG